MLVITTVKDQQKLAKHVAALTNCFNPF